MNDASPAPASKFDRFVVKYREDAQRVRQALDRMLAG